MLPTTRGLRMADLDNDDVMVLVTACETDLGDPSLWFTPDGYRDSLALCIIDSIYSTGARYSSVVNVLKRYRDYRSNQGGNPDTDGTDELAATIAELGGPDPGPPASAIAVRLPPRRGPPESRKRRRGPCAGRTTEVSSGPAAATADGLRAVERAWRPRTWAALGITWDYARMLAQIPGVKADRTVLKYVTRAIGCRPGSMLPERAADLVSRVAQAKGWNVIHLDHAIWRFESGRPFQARGRPRRQ